MAYCPDKVILQGTEEKPGSFLGSERVQANIEKNKSNLSSTDEGKPDPWVKEYLEETYNRHCPQGTLKTWVGRVASGSDLFRKTGKKKKN